VGDGNPGYGATLSLSDLCKDKDEDKEGLGRESGIGKEEKH
jgi:hypothetical protein